MTTAASKAPDSRVPGLLRRRLAFMVLSPETQRQVAVGAWIVHGAAFALFWAAIGVAKRNRESEGAAF